MHQHEIHLFFWIKNIRENDNDRKIIETKLQNRDKMLSGIYYLLLGIMRYPETVSRLCSKDTHIFFHIESKTTRQNNAFYFWNKN